MSPSKACTCGGEDNDSDEEASDHIPCILSSLVGGREGGIQNLNQAGIPDLWVTLFFQRENASVF